MALQIPLQAVGAQVIKVVLSGQNCQINLYQKNEGLFCDVNADNVEIVSGALCQEATPIISRNYTGFAGNLLFIDTLGNSAPNYSGLDSRFALIYLDASEYGLIQ